MHDSTLRDTFLVTLQTSVQCVDNADGVNGVVVYGGETFAMTSEPVRDAVRFEVHRPKLFK